MFKGTNFNVRFDVDQENQGKLRKHKKTRHTIEPSHAKYK